MADIELMIKIPEELKRALDNNEEYRLYTESVGHAMLTAIKNGTPLPEHHSDLIERDALLDNVQDYGEGQCKLMLLDPYYVRRAKAIITATKEGD